MQPLGLCARRAHTPRECTVPPSRGCTPTVRKPRGPCVHLPGALCQPVWTVKPGGQRAWLPRPTLPAARDTWSRLSTCPSEITSDPQPRVLGVGAESRSSQVDGLGPGTPVVVETGEALRGDGDLLVRCPLREVSPRDHGTGPPAPPRVPSPPALLPALGMLPANLAAPSPFFQGPPPRLFPLRTNKCIFWPRWAGKAGVLRSQEAMSRPGTRLSFPTCPQWGGGSRLGS